MIITIITDIKGCLVMISIVSGSHIIAGLFFFMTPVLVAKTHIRLAGPASVVSYPLMVIAEQNLLAKQDLILDFTLWRNPEQLRAMVLSEQVDIAAMPSNVAANFYNQGHHVTLMNISIWNILSIVSRDPHLNTLAQLKGQEIVVPFKNDMPAILMKTLLHHQLGNEAYQVKIRYSHSVMDAAQLLLSGQVQHAVLVEPMSALVIHQNQQVGGAPLKRSLNISALWRDSFPLNPALPQAGLVANTSINKNTALLGIINQAYQQAASWCQQDAVACAEIVTKKLPQMPKAALVDAIKSTSLNVVDAHDARNELEGFYQLLLGTEPAKIGHQLPPAGFYQ